jgi:predicted xylose isomerase-like sugar epimerase
VTKSIPGVPESITRAQYLGLIESLGFDVLHLRSLEFSADGIRAVVIAIHPDGRHVIDAANDTVAEHSIFIPVVEDPK